MDYMIISVSLIIAQLGILEIYLHFSYSYWPIFMTLGEMNDTDNVMNPQSFGSNPADIWIRIRINPAIWI